jgi:hypothetical protein
VLKAVSRSMARASVMFLVCPLGRSSAGLSTYLCPRSSVSLAHHAVPQPLDSSPRRSLAKLLDVVGTGVLVCFRSCSRSGCGSGRDTGGLTGSG